MYNLEEDHNITRELVEAWYPCYSEKQMDEVFTKDEFTAIEFVMNSDLPVNDVDWVLVRAYPRTYTDALIWALGEFSRIVFRDCDTPFTEFIQRFVKTKSTEGHGFYVDQLYGNEFRLFNLARTLENISSRLDFLGLNNWFEDTKTLLGVKRRRSHTAKLITDDIEAVHRILYRIVREHYTVQEKNLEFDTFRVPVMTMVWVKQLANRSQREMNESEENG